MKPDHELTVAREIVKGKTGKMLIDGWRTSQGRGLVSVVQLFRDSGSGEFIRKKGGFALTPAEARDLAAALVEVACHLEASDGVK